MMTVTMVMRRKSDNDAEDDFDDSMFAFFFFLSFCGLELVQRIQTHSNLNMQNLETRLYVRMVGPISPPRLSQGGLVVICSHSQGHLQ